MNKPSLHSKSLTTASILFGVPILFAFVIGSIPVLIPILLFRWLARLIKPGTAEAPAIAQPA